MIFSVLVVGFLLATLVVADPTIVSTTYHVANTTIGYSQAFVNQTVPCDWGVGTRQSAVTWTVRDLPSQRVDVQLCNQVIGTAGTTCWLLAPNQLLAAGQDDTCYQNYVPTGVPEGTYWLALTSGSTIVASAASGGAVYVPGQLVVTEFVEPMYTGWHRNIYFRGAHMGDGNVTLPGNMTAWVESPEGIPIWYKEPRKTDDHIRVYIPHNVRNGTYLAVVHVFNATRNYALYVPLEVADNEDWYYSTLIAIAVALFLIWAALLAWLLRRLLRRRHHHDDEDDRRRRHGHNRVDDDDVDHNHHHNDAHHPPVD